jgi:membrane associated rhomboid family serine protease
LGAPLSGGAPVMTISAISLCVAVFALQQITGGRLEQAWIMAPVMVPSQPWRLLTAAFLHGGIMHLLLNMYALWVVGGVVEQLVGRCRFAVVCIACALAGNTAALVYFRVADFTYEGAVTGTLGASGMVFGLFAAAFVLARRLGCDIRGIAAVIGLNLVLGFVIGGISWQAHIGGLAMGAALAAVYAYAPRGRRRLYAALAAGGAGLVLAVMVLAVLYL